eukprot:GEMP01021413.1.p2 GENE.GEMP01021413.1~~GEMP01021413.1.p2  ORF type:complete len:266 (+),score=60.33 GEMP01021413.1:282-1079(+)
MPKPETSPRQSLRTPVQSAATSRVSSCESSMLPSISTRAGPVKSTGGNSACTVKFAADHTSGDDGGESPPENSKASSDHALSTTLLRTRRTDKQRDGASGTQTSLHAPSSKRSYIVPEGVSLGLTKLSPPQASGVSSIFRKTSPTSPTRSYIMSSAMKKSTSNPHIHDDSARSSKVRTVSAPHRKTAVSAKTVPGKRVGTSIGTVATDADGENLKKGDIVYRKGRLCTIVKVDYMCDPPALVVKMNDTGSEVGTELTFISLSPPR